MLAPQMSPGRDHQDFHRIRSPLEGSLVRLRAIEEEDVARINELFWDTEVTRFLTVAWPEPVAGTREWWEQRRQDERSATFAIESLAGEFIGVCDLGPVALRERTATLGIWIARPHWDKGYGTDAVRTLCRFGFQELNLQRIGLAVYDFNVRGRRAYERVGFMEEGRLRRGHFVDGRYVDVVIMGLLGEELIEE
jgi:RimJ/RimL family protein N-acetyltransferase